MCQTRQFVFEFSAFSSVQFSIEFSSVKGKKHRFQIFLHILSLYMYYTIIKQFLVQKVHVFTKKINKN